MNTPRRSVLRTPLLSLAAGLALVAAAAAGSAYTDAKTGYSATVPDGWQHKVDRSRGALVLRGPGEVRVRVETRDNAALPAGRDANTWYRGDGARLKRSSAAFKVTGKPDLEEEGPLAGRETWTYAFAYKTRSGKLYRARGYLAGGTSREEEEKLHLRVLVYGPARPLAGAGAALDGFLGSFVWPEPEVEDPPPTDEGDPGDVVVAGTTTTTPDRDAKGTERREAERERKIASGIEFDNGSLKGGLGVMASGGVSRNRKRNMAFIKASRVSHRHRGEQERDKAARYLGFNKKKSE